MIAREVLKPIGRHKGLQFPIQRIEGSPWIKVGETWESDTIVGKYGTARSMRPWREPDLLISEIHYDGDDPNFVFHDAKDYPRLPATTVEDANRRHRKEFRLRLCRIKDPCDPYYRNMFKNEFSAEQRLRVHKGKPWEAGGVMIPKVGGYILANEPLPDGGDYTVDWIAEMVKERLDFKAMKDFQMADLMRREIGPSGATLFDHADGTEFVFQDDF